MNKISTLIEKYFTGKKASINDKDISKAAYEDLRKTPYELSKTEMQVFGPFFATTYDNGSFTNDDLKAVKSYLRLVLLNNPDGKKAEQKLNHQQKAYDDAEKNNDPIYRVLVSNAEFPTTGDNKVFLAEISNYFKVCQELKEMTRNENGELVLNVEGMEQIEIDKEHSSKTVVTSLLNAYDKMTKEESFKLNAEKYAQDYPELVKATELESARDTVVLLATMLSLREIFQEGCGEELNKIYRIMTPYLYFSIDKASEGAKNIFIQDMAKDIIDKRFDELNTKASETDYYDIDNIDGYMHDLKLAEELSRVIPKGSVAHSYNISQTKREGTMRPFSLVTDYGPLQYKETSQVEVKDRDEAIAKICSEDLGTALAGFKYFDDKFVNLDDGVDAKEVAELMLTNLLIMENKKVPAQTKERLQEMFIIPLAQAAKDLKRIDIKIAGTRALEHMGEIDAATIANYADFGKSAITAKKIMQTVNKVLKEKDIRGALRDNGVTGKAIVNVPHNTKVLFEILANGGQLLTEMEKIKGASIATDIKTESLSRAENMMDGKKKFTQDEQKAMMAQLQSETLEILKKTTQNYGSNFQNNGPIVK